jgi:hypothetical protein
VASSAASAGSYLRKRKNFKLRSSRSVEQLAHSHAEDVLSLSLELERAKLALQTEQTAHMKTKLALAEAFSKKSLLEAQIEKLLNDMETQREDHGRKTDLLEEDLERAKMRVQAAEVDAQEALDLAKGFAEHRDELEDSLQQALQEIQVLRGSASSNALPPGDDHMSLSGGVIPRSRPPPPKGPPPRQPLSEKKGVRFADMASDLQTSDNRMTMPTTSTTGATPHKSQLPRSMVAAGREVLHRHAATSNAIASPEQQAIVINTQKSAERRNLLRERLQAVGSDIVIASPPPRGPAAAAPVPPPPPVSKQPYENKARETFIRVASMLRESAQRVGFTGHWWATTSVPSNEDVVAMTRSYCQSVEVRNQCCHLFSLKFSSLSFPSLFL